MKSYREFTRKDFKEIADEGFVEQITSLNNTRERLAKVMQQQPTKESKDAFIKALQLYDEFKPYLQELEDENISADDKWLFCYILDIILLRIEEYFDERTDKNPIIEKMFW